MIEKIKISNKKDLTNEEIDIINKQIKIYSEKFEKIFKNIKNFEVIIKKYQTEGLNCKYSILLKIKINVITYSSNCLGWKLSPVLKKCLNKIFNEIENKRQ